MRSHTINSVHFDRLIENIRTLNIGFMDMNK